ncbi:hypothetical protein JHK82_049897 [Glycine max]|nr:hypothetical protein JHK82_049897 [Glycine max]
MWQIKGLLVLGLSSNSLFGPIPASVGNLSNLRALCLEGNMMNGKLPRSIGAIPDGVGMLGLSIIDLSNNSLSDLPLGKGVVVANAVEQELALPKKESLCAMVHCCVHHWVNFDGAAVIRAKVSYARKNGLLGYNVFQIGNDKNWELSKAAQEVDEEVEDRHKKRLVIIVLLATLTLALLLGIVFCYYRRGFDYSSADSLMIAEE